MSKSFPTWRVLSGLTRKNDVFLLLLLTASLSLNVYLGWSLKRLRSFVPPPPNPINLPSGMTVQPVTAVGLSGKQEAISYADAGKPTVFYVFSPSCVWCDRNTQNINALAGMKGESFRFIGLSLAEEGLAAYVQSHHLTFPVYKNLTPEAVKMLGLGTTPQTIVISPDGQVLKNWSGAYVKPLQPQVEEFFGVRLPGLVPLPPK